RLLPRGTHQDRAQRAFAHAAVQPMRGDLRARPVVVGAVGDHELHLVAGTPGLAPRELAAWILADRLPVRMQVQMHKVIWDPRTRGV
ncbi:MAG: hypothetical protein ACKOGJ_01160, partial [Phycisphaerales bacterium]